MHREGRYAQPRTYASSVDAVQRAATLVRATAVQPASWGELAVALSCLGMTPDAPTLERVRRALESA